MDILIGFPNKLIHNLGTRIMLDPIVNKFLYYSDVEDENILELPDVENPIGLLKNNKVFYSRRIDKVLDNADIQLYITLYDYAPLQKRFEKSSSLSTTKIEIGVVCHAKCRDTLNGLRDLIVMQRIADILEEDENRDIAGIGKIKIDTGIRHLYNMPNPEYDGFQMVVRADNFTGAK